MHSTDTWGLRRLFSFKVKGGYQVGKGTVKKSKRMIGIEDLPILFQKFQRGEITEEEFKSALDRVKHLLKEMRSLLNELEKLKEEMDRNPLQLNGGDPV